MHLKFTPGCQISTLIFENKLWRGALYKYPIKNISGTAVLGHCEFKLKVLSGFLTDLSV